MCKTSTRRSELIILGYEIRAKDQFYLYSAIDQIIVKKAYKASGKSKITTQGILGAEKGWADCTDY